MFVPSIIETLFLNVRKLFGTHYKMVTADDMSGMSHDNRVNIAVGDAEQTNVNSNILRIFVMIYLSQVAPSVQCLTMD
jgi:hypothetical protein